MGVDTHKVEIVGVNLEPHPDPETTSLSIVRVYNFTVVVRTEDWQGVTLAVWFGNSLRTIRKVVESGVAGLVEGPFDLLASRLVSPEAPVLTPLTKRIGKEHIAYLRMLGIHTLYFLYDNEASAKGQTAAYLQSQDVKISMKSVVLRCPAADPSDALRTVNGTLALKSLLDHLV